LFDDLVELAALEPVDRLKMFLGHIAMDAAKREHLYRETRRRIASAPTGGCDVTGTRSSTSPRRRAVRAIDAGYPRRL
jgi:hypothetical protein